MDLVDARVFVVLEEMLNQRLCNFLGGFNLGAVGVSDPVPLPLALTEREVLQGLTSYKVVDDLFAFGGQFFG